MRLFLWLSILGLAACERVVRVRRQLDWNGRDFNFDHVPMSADAAIAAVAPGDTSHLTIPGEPGVDYPVLPSIPLTHFHCRGQVPGYYGDTETACQVFHVCEMNGRQDSFLCPNGTIFSQKLFACDWWYNVKCDSTESHYRLNRNLFQGSDIGLYGSNSFWNWVHEAEQIYATSRERFEKYKPTQQVAQRAPLPAPEEILGEQFDSEEVLPPVTNPIAAQPDREVRKVPETAAVNKVPATAAPLPAWTGARPHKVEHMADLPHPAVEDIDFSPELSWEDLRPSGPLMVPGKKFTFLSPGETPKVKHQKSRVVPQASAVQAREVRPTGKKIVASPVVQKFKSAPSAVTTLHDIPQAVSYQHFQLGVTAPAPATKFGPIVAPTTVAPSIAVAVKVAAPAFQSKRPVAPPVDFEDDYYDDYEDEDYYDELEEEDEFQGQLYPPVPLAVLNQYNTAHGLPKTAAKTVKPKLPVKVVPPKPVKATKAKPAVSKVKSPVPKSASVVVPSVAQPVVTTPRQPVAVQQPKATPTPVETPVQPVVTTPRQPQTTPSVVEIEQSAETDQVPETTPSGVYFSPLPSLKSKKQATQSPYADVSQLPLAMPEQPHPAPYLAQIPQLPANYEALTDLRPLKSVAAPAGPAKVKSAASSKLKVTTPKLKTTTAASIPAAVPSNWQEPATARTPVSVTSTTPVQTSTTTMKAALKVKQSSRNLKLRTAAAAAAAAAPSSTVRSVPVSTVPVQVPLVKEQRDYATDIYPATTEAQKPVLTTSKQQVFSTMKAKIAAAQIAAKQVKPKSAQLTPTSTENVKIASTTPRASSPEKTTRRAKAKNLRKSTRAPLVAHSAVEPAKSGSFVTVISTSEQPQESVVQSSPSPPVQLPGFQGLNRRRYVRLNNPVWSIENWESTKV